MEIGTCVVTLTDKLATDGLDKVFILKGSMGTVCEIYDDYALVEIWGEHLPKGVWVFTIFA